MELLRRFGYAFERLIIRMQGIDDTCVELTQDITKQDLSLIGRIGDKGDMIMREIAEQIDVPLSTATWVVDKLVEKKYLIRFPSENDRRIVKVKLAKKGRDVYELFVGMKMEMGQKIFAILTEEEGVVLTELMEKVEKAMRSNREEIEVRDQETK